MCLFIFFQKTAPQYATIILGRDSDGGTMTCLFTDPMVGSHRPLATRRTEVLPQPDGPTTSKRSPGPDSKMMKNADQNADQTPMPQVFGSRCLRRETKTIQALKISKASKYVQILCLADRTLARK